MQPFQRYESKRSTW